MKKLITLLIALSCIFVLSACTSNNQTKRETVSDSAVATFEYIEDKGYKLITSEIDSLDTFDGLMLKQAEVDFTGEWVYRIIFNPQKYSKNTEEVVILFGEECVSINDETYIADDNVSYSDILSWAEAKYKFFDYDLITD
ncbi:MAG: hypothetical protein IKM20_10610 [Erysipelotrichales bacterium]|nr:hypothetical protein [Erysipelotrichales bacterium]